MEFFPRKKKNPPAVIIVALIDVLIVVLIFLLVTTTFKQQPAITLALPESSEAKTEGASELAPVFISVDGSGQIFLGANSEPVTDEVLRAELAALAAGNPQVQIALEPDRSAPVESFIRVWDAATAAGIKKPLRIHTRAKEVE